MSDSQQFTLPAREAHVHEWYVGCRGCDENPDVSRHYVVFTEDTYKP
jgi:hypothetical protein